MVLRAEILAKYLRFSNGILQYLILSIANYGLCWCSWICFAAQELEEAGDSDEHF